MTCHRTRQDLNFVLISIFVPLTFGVQVTLASVEGNAVLRIVPGGAWGTM